MGDQSVKPGRWIYSIPVLCFAGLAFICVSIGIGILNMTGGLKRVIMPGEVEVALSKEGEYVIFYEYKSVMNNRTYSTGESLPDLAVGHT